MVSLKVISCLNDLFVGIVRSFLLKINSFYLDTELGKKLSYPMSVRSNKCTGLFQKLKGFSKFWSIAKIESKTFQFYLNVFSEI